ncbi:RuvA C-terminal domain-containing protein [uncultured Helicobacter sp.]|nr:RuvA C-terminal domain-containing protein [uncultured Helicobacter sp.]
MALRSLGFKESEINKVLESVNASSVSEAVREALKRLA